MRSYDTGSLVRRSRTVIPLLVLTGAIAFLTACREQAPLTPAEDHMQAEGMALLQDSTVVCAIFRGMTSDTLRVADGGASPWFDVMFYDAERTLIEPDRDPGHSFVWQFADSTLADVEQDPADIYRIRFHGTRAGGTSIEFFVLHGGHADFRTNRMPFHVTP
jgi:hypothetical protein